MKNETIINDGALTPQEKEQILRQFYEKQQKQIHMGKIFMLLTLFAVIADCIVTSALYPLYAADLIGRSFIETYYHDSSFILNIVIAAVIIVKLTLAVSSVVCVIKKTVVRPVLATSCIIAAFIDILICVLQFTDPATYTQTETVIYGVLNIVCLAAVCAGVYMTVLTDKISAYTYEKQKMDEKQDL